jgi:hypothetical protein
MRAPLATTAALLAALAACRGRASDDQCAAMKARYLDLAVTEAPNAASMTDAQRAAVREVERGLKRAEPTYRFVDDHCGGVTRAEASCALRAESTRAWEACVHPADAR